MHAMPRTYRKPRKHRQPRKPRQLWKLALALGFAVGLVGGLGFSPGRAADDPPARTAPAPAPAQAGGVRAHLTAETPLIDAPGKKLTMVHVTFDPGGAMKSHQHGGTVLVYVVAGAIRSQIEGGSARVYHAGESWVEQPGARHVVCENASATEPAELVAALLADAGPATAPTSDAPPDTLVPSGRHHE